MLAPTPTVSLILKSWLIVGTLDILSAFVDVYVSSGRNPFIVLNYVASGAFGPAAMQAGAAMAFAGLLFHYLIAFTFTIIFYLLYNPLRFYKVNVVLLGILYGIFIWFVMNRLVVPLSHVNHPAPKPFNLLKFLKPMLILIAMIGLPLSLIAGKALSGRGETATKY